MADEERRKDPETRDRLTHLEKQLQKRVVAMEKRLHWLSRKLLIGQLWLALAIVGMGGGFYFLYNQVQDSRVDAADRNCETRNDEHRAIREFVTPFIDNEAERVDVNKSFPITENCREWAKQSVGQ